MIHLTFSKFIACLFFHSNLVSVIQQETILDYYMPLVEIKDFDALIDNKPFFNQPVKNK